MVWSTSMDRSLSSVTVQFIHDHRIWYIRYIINGMLYVNCWINGIKRCYPRCRKRYCQRQDGSLRVEQYELFRISNWISFNWSIVSILIFCQTNHAFAQFRRTHKELKTSTLTHSLWLIILTVFWKSIWYWILDCIRTGIWHSMTFQISNQHIIWYYFMLYW